MEHKQAGEIFENLRSIHQDREQYNLEWAFRNAQEEMDTFRSKILKGKLEKQCASCDKSREAMEKYKEILANSRSIGKKSKWYQRFFQNIYSLLTLAEVAVSFTLVFLLSQVSHMGGMMIHSEGFSILFAMTFSFLKVVLERYWVEPRMNDWGWKVYIESVDRLDRTTMELFNFTQDKVHANQIPLASMGGMQGAVFRQISSLRRQETGALAKVK